LLTSQTSRQAWAFDKILDQCAQATASALEKYGLKKAKCYRNRTQVVFSAITPKVCFGPEADIGSDGQQYIKIPDHRCTTA
jgi:hypothetical protein